MRMPTRLHQYLLAGCALAALVAVTQWGRSSANAARSAWPPEADLSYLPSANTLRIASLGHHELFSDLLAARANIYFGDQHEKKGEYRWLASYLDAVTALDPYFEPIYLRGAVMLTNGTEVTQEAPLRLATELLRRGVKLFPGSWELHFQLGFNLYFELPKFAKGPAQKKAWRKEGMEALRKTTLFDRTPSWMPNLVANMLTEGGEQELAIKHLERVYAATSDEQTRLEIQGKLNRMVGEHYASNFSRQVQRLARLVETRFPYAPEAFSLIVGRRFTPYAPLRATLVDPATEPTDAIPTAQNQLPKAP